MAGSAAAPFGELLSRHRLAAGLTQEELAERAALSARGISDLERGVRSRPQPPTVHRLAAALCLAPDERLLFEAAAHAPASLAAGDHSVNGGRPAANVLGALPSGALVARAEEVARIEAILDTVAGGTGQLLVLAGEAGVGKTRLAQEIMVLAQHRGFLVGVGTCSQDDQQLPGAAVRHALAALVAGAPGAVHAEALRRWRELQRLLPGDAATPGAEDARLDRQFFGAVAEFLIAIAAHVPVAVLLDDLHGADDATVQLVRALAYATHGAPVLLVGTLRDARLREDHPVLARVLEDLSRARLVEHIGVRRLVPEVTPTRVPALPGQAAGAEEVAAAVHHHGKGTPPDPGAPPSSAPSAPAAPGANPFFNRGPVRDPAYYFGRARETAFLADLLRQGQSVAVNGPRRLGKTSLLFHIANPAVAAAHGLAPETTRWLYLDGGSLDGLGEEWLYGAIDSALGGAEDAVPYPRLVARLQDLAEQGVRVILALDEFELVAANPHFGLTVFNRLRGLTARFPVQMVTASRDPLLDLTVGHPDTLSSPFFNIFAPLHLPLFSEEDALALLAGLSERGGRPFGPRTRAWLLETVGPHPLFLQVAGYRAFAALAGTETDGEISSESRQAVRAAIASDLEQHVRYYWQSLTAEERYTLAALPLLDPGEGSPVRERLAAAGLLRGDGYLGSILEEFVRHQQIEGLLQAGPVALDLRRGRASVRGALVHLTPTEFGALRVFLERRGQVLTPEELEAALWPGEFVADPERARGVVKKLRGALGDAGEIIVNRRGQGYLLATE